jgi:hypothetical protein
MSEKRKFHRIPFTAKTLLNFQNEVHQGQLENISMNGALVRLTHGTDLHVGDVYDVEIFLDYEDNPLQLQADVRCINFAMAGMKFISFTNDTEARLRLLIDSLSSNPHSLHSEQERIRRRLADYFREE